MMIILLFWLFYNNKKQYSCVVLYVHANLSIHAEFIDFLPLS